MLEKSKHHTHRRRRIGRNTLYLVLCLLFVLTLVIGCYRFRSFQRETASNREIAPASGRFVPAADVEIFIQESGPADGDILVFIHGTGAWGEIFRETMIPLNEAGYRTVTLDLPPFGFSDRPIENNYDRDEQARRILGVIDSLERDRVTLVGHSFGGVPQLRRLC